MFLTKLLTESLRQFPQSIPAQRLHKYLSLGGPLLPHGAPAYAEHFHQSIQDLTVTMVECVHCWHLEYNLKVVEPFLQRPIIEWIFCCEVFLCTCR